MENIKVRGLRTGIIMMVLLCAIAFMPVFSADAQASAKTKFGVSTTTVTITAGSGKSVTAKGLSAKKLKKVTWKSGNKSVARVSKSKGKTVKIKAVKAGSTTIIASYGKTKKKIAVTVKSKQVAEPAETVDNNNATTAEQACGNCTVISGESGITVILVDKDGNKTVLKSGDTKTLPAGEYRVSDILLSTATASKVESVKTSTENVVVEQGTTAKVSVLCEYAQTDSYVKSSEEEQTPTEEAVTIAEE